MPSQTSLVGAAGEHFVMFQLLRQGMIAALAPIGVPNSDIIVTDELGDKVCAVQVKTRSGIGRDGGWHMSVKHERLISNLLFYVFVDFESADIEPIKSYVLPSQVVAEVLASAHQKWLATPGKGGRRRKDGTMRRLLPDYDGKGIEIGKPKGWLDEYRDAWHLIRNQSDL